MSTTEISTTEDSATRFRPTRRALLTGLGLSALLAGCGVELAPLGPTPGPATPTIPTPGPTVPAAETLGTGSVSMALLVPLSGSGAAVGRTLRNAAQLALSDLAAPDLRIAVRDTGGTAAGAAAAAQAALAGGAELILGPVFADEVRAVSPIARAAGIPVLAFSTDVSVAAPGVYLLNVLIAQEVSTIVGAAANQGKRGFAALLPNDAYGTVAEAAFRQAVARAGGRVAAVQRYNPDEASALAGAQAIVAAGGNVDAVLIPEGGAVAPFLAQTLVTAGLDTNAVLLLGSGQWNDPGVYTNAALVGGQFPSPPLDQFQAFANHYRATFADTPQPIAGLAYEGIVLAAGLVRTAGTARFQPASLQRAGGFRLDVNGLVRLNADGTNARGLAVYRVTGSAPALVVAAPTTFA